MSDRPSLDLNAFREPSRAFGILPFWFLNGELDPDEMLVQLREFRDKGMPGIILHGRYGLDAGGRLPSRRKSITVFCIRGKYVSAE